MNVEKVIHVTYTKELTNGAKSIFSKYWEYFLDQYGIPFGYYCVKGIYMIYNNLNLFNVMIFLIKFIPTIIYMHHFIKNIYVSSRERMKLKQLELEELQLQVQIVKTKLSVREAEFTERAELLRRKVEQLRQVRARVRKIISSDEDLKKAVSGSVISEEESNLHDDNTYGDESKFIIELLKELNSDKVAATELDPHILNCVESSDQPSSIEESIYSSVSEVNSKSDCQVKIIKVTNVYKVSYLRHFIKQKRLRRANKQAILRKQMDNIKKLLEDWQNTLSMVINSKISLLSFDSPHIGIVSHEAMGDCSKGIYNFSDSDSDFRNSTEYCHDEYNMSWSGSQGKSASVSNNYDDLLEDTLTKEYSDREFEQYNGYSEQNNITQVSSILYTVPEETKSQLEIKELQRDDN